VDVQDADRDDDDDPNDPSPSNNNENGKDEKNMEYISDKNNLNVNSFGESLFIPFLAIEVIA